MIAALLLIQAVPARMPIDPPTQAAPERSWSIKTDPYAQAPYATERCPENSSDVVVCARPNAELRLPLPAERGPPDGPRKSVAYLDGAQGPQAAPCGAQQKGCTTGVDLIGGAKFLYKLGKKIADPDGE
ncbi:hypothetical protein [Sphingomonas sp.]|uniref:hypothetical protein n=1 Tax=Sphingomonas sp. TaxID=28214 RepID=UPI0035BC45DA